MKQWHRVLSFLALLSVCSSGRPNPQGQRVEPTVVHASTFAGLLADQGIGYSPFRDGESPNGEPFPTLEEMRADLEQLRGVAGTLRTYGSSRWLRPLAAEAERLGFSVLAGAWLGTDRERNQEELESVIAIAKEGHAGVVIVGNEVLLRGDLTLDDLITTIRHVRANVPATVLVTTAEPWSEWVNRAELRDAVDLLLVHIYPFWEGQGIDDAVSYFAEKAESVRAVAGDKPILVGETGWPSAGTSAQAHVPAGVQPGPEQQRRYLEGIASLAAERGIRFCWFSAYDEEWKWSEGAGSSETNATGMDRSRSFSGSVAGSSWGILTSSGDLKPHLAELFPELPPNASRKVRVLFDRRGLASMYDVGVDSSGRRRDWLRMTRDGLELAYPAGQAWGAVFVTVGEPSDPPRPWKDFSPFRTLSVELRGERGGESLEIGLKDACDRDDGSETKIPIDSCSTEWTTVRIPLARFRSADLKQLYVPIEFVFSGAQARTVQVRDVRFLQ